MSCLLRICACCALVVFFATETDAQASSTHRQYESNSYNNNQARLGQRGREAIATTRRRTRYRERRRNWEELRLPLVFHVLYRQEGTEPLSEEVIYEQVAGLNADFGGANVPAPGVDARDVDGAFRKLSVAAKISFCYPRRVKSRSRSGASINYIPVTDADLSELNHLRSARGKAPAFNTKRYVNVWIVPEDAVATGFAQYPGGKGSLDGIVISAAYFGRGEHTRANYGGGKTLTHLMGNYLGLRPIWGDGPCGDDGIRDTPLHNAPNYNKPRAYHCSICTSEKVPEMTMNFMDNTDDDQLYLFTRQQVRYMRAVLTRDGPRRQLASTQTRCSPPSGSASAATLAGNSLRSSEAEATSGEVTARFSLSPNPATDFIDVRVTGLPAGEQSSGYRIKVYSVTGSLQYEALLTGGAAPSRRIPTADWPRGVYLINLTGTEEDSEVHYTGKLALQ